MNSGWNLPDGCFTYMIPGNRPEDVTALEIEENMTDEEVLELCVNNRNSCIHSCWDDDFFTGCGMGISDAGDSIVDCPYIREYITTETSRRLYDF